MSTHEQLFLPADRPYESRHFPPHGRHRFPLVLAPADQPIEPAVQPLLRLPRNRADLRRDAHAPLSQRLTHPRLPPVVPRRFYQYVPHMGIARLRDRTLTAMRA